MSDRQRQYLRTMGIEVWSLRQDSDVRLSPNSAHRDGESGATDINSEPGSGQAPDSAAPQAPAPPPDGRSENIARLDWQGLRAAVEECRACPLHQSRTQAVFGVGDHNADWMIIGEAPGADEDRVGEPFVGRAGKLLDLMLKAIELRREQVFIANILKSRPPRNRDPAADEILACRPYLERQIELVQPKLILCMGRIAAQTLLQTQTAVGKLRGTVYRYGRRKIPFIVTYHPAYLLRSPREKRKSWADLQLACQAAGKPHC